MSLAERASHPRPGERQGMPCSVDVLLKTLPPEESAALAQMLGDERWQHAAIEQALKDEGHFVGHGTVGKHRRQSCRCFRQR